MTKWSWIAYFAVILTGRGSLLAQTAPATVNTAEQAMSKGDYALAESQLRALLSASPASFRLLDDLGRTLELQGKSDDAIRIFHQALKIKRLPDTIALLAVAHCRNHDFARASPLLHEAGGRLTDPGVMATVGPCFLEADQPEGAIALYENLVRLAIPPEDEIQANLSRAYFDLSRKVLEKLTSVPGGVKYARTIELSRKGGNPDAKFLFPDAYEHASYLQPDMSIPALLPFLNTHPDDPSLLYILGVQSAERAADTLDQIESRWPESIAYKSLVAELKDAGGDRDGAIRVYEQILATYPDAPASVHFALGLMYAERYRWADALRQYKLTGGPALGSLYLTQRMSEAMLNANQNNEVITLLGPIVHNAGAPVWAVRDFGEAAQNLNQFHLALAYLKKASGMNPGDATIHYRLFLLYRSMKQPQSAASELATFRGLKGSDKPAQTVP